MTDETDAIPPLPEGKPRRQPSTEHEWTVHALNIHGLFFERWCENTIAAQEGWSVRGTNIPVEYRQTMASARESALDVLAESDLASGPPVSLIVEAKKNNPEFVRWVF